MGIAEKGRHGAGICERCGKKYEKKVFWQKYCSKPCKLVVWALKEANKVMKKNCILFFLLLICGNVFAHPIDMRAIAKIESSDNPKAVGKHGEIGLYQISPIVLKHFNQTHSFEAKKSTNGYSSEDLKNASISRIIASWYLSWLFDRCWTVKDTLIAWNWGIGNWREWRSTSDNQSNRPIMELPKTTQAYLKKYEELTGEKLS